MLQRLNRALSSPSAAPGQFGSVEPLSKVFGYDRGTPIDRLYIEKFVAGHSTDIRGRVLEVTDDSYSRRFGGNRISGQDVLHLDDGNRSATIVGDVADPMTLPAGRFDCIILTQTLQYVFELGIALDNIRRALKPGGVVLITVPGISPVCASQWSDEHYWLFTASSLRRSLTGAFDAGKVQVSAYGNLYAATGFLHGAAVEELERDKLEPVQLEYAIVIGARAVA